METDVKKFEEDFPKEYKRPYHNKRHVTQSGFSDSVNPHGRRDYEFTKYEYEDEYEYERGANEFALTPLSNDVEEFMGTDGHLHKFRHSTGHFVLYDENKSDKSNPIIYSYYLMDENRWSRDNKDFNPDYLIWRMANAKYNPYYGD